LSSYTPRHWVARVPRGCHSPYPLLWAPEGSASQQLIVLVIAGERTTKKTPLRIPYCWIGCCCLGTELVENAVFPLLRSRLGSDHIENMSRVVCLATVVNKRFYCWVLTYSVHVTLFWNQHMFNSTKKTSGDGVTVLRRNGMLLSHFERNRDAIPPHLTPWLYIYIYIWVGYEVPTSTIWKEEVMTCRNISFPSYFRRVTVVGPSPPNPRRHSSVTIVKTSSITCLPSRVTSLAGY
jgi:hypothetical protein